MGFLSGLFGGGMSEWNARMGWRYVACDTGAYRFAMLIEPMMRGPDLVYTPDESIWRDTAPRAVRGRLDDILARLRSTPWNRQLVWRATGNVAPISIERHLLHVRPGSLESTPAGRELEHEWYFEPGGTIPFEQARKLWIELDRKFVSAATGAVTIDAENEGAPGSVFREVELPLLKANPKVTLERAA
ncbi:MAG: hypothetical protein ACF8PN_05845 [Phycisphaerales bacterium]